MKLKTGLMGLLCLFFRVSAQPGEVIYPLKTGEILPQKVFHNVINYPSNHISLTDFRNKLVILDFWSTSCGSCIAMLPKQVKLQQQFKDNMQILLVDCKNTRDTKQRVVNFFNAFHPAYKTLPSIVEDTVLAAYFPHRSVGYYVWLYNGKVMTTADEENINADNIRQFLSGHHPVFALKNDIPYDVNQPLFENGNGGGPPRLFTSTTWASYKPGLHSSSAYAYNGNRLCTGFTMVNSSRYSFCLLAFPQIQAVPYNRLIFNAMDAAGFLRGSNKEPWRRHNLYTYQTTFSAIPIAVAQKRIQADIIHFFHLRLDSAYRMTKCYVIKLNGGTRPPESSDKDNNTFIRDIPISVPLGYLNDRSGIPYVDESGFTGTIRMTYSLDDLTTDQMVTKLEEKGFKVESAIRTLKCYTITETSEAGQ